MQPFEDQVISLSAFFGLAPENEITLPYRLRYDVLFSRFRLIALEEGVRMLGPLRRQREPSRHASLLIQSLHDLMLNEAPKHIAALGDIIAQCEVKNLKRLEAESRLVQVCFHLLLKGTEKQSELEVITSLNRVSELCQTYPETAGLLEKVYTAVRASILGNQPISKMYDKESLAIWWSWPKHELGSLQYCKNDHPYSGVSGMGCLECGQEVEQVTPDKPDSHLQEVEFLAAMKNFS